MTNVVRLNRKMTNFRLQTKSIWLALVTYHVWRLW